MNSQRVSVLVVSVLIVLSGGVAASAQGVDCSKVPYPKPITVTDAEWNRTASYSTFRAVDVDGDGRSELMIRGRDGLHMFSSDSASGNWVERAKTPRVLSDSEGWNDPSRYSTIRYGALRSGTRAQDMVARNGDGIHTYRWNEVEARWKELVPDSSSGRPLADGGSATDWKLPQHYGTILMGDADGDGISELIARGVQGIETFRWDETLRQWVSAGGSTALSDPSFENVSQYATLQMTDLHGNGKQLLVVRAASGMQALEWKDKGWVLVHSSSLFANGSGIENPDRFRTIQVAADADGGRWLVGLVQGRRGGTSRAVALYRWNDGQGEWDEPEFIDLPGQGWDSEDRYATIQGADVDGDGRVEITARDDEGLRVYKRRAQGNGWRQLPTLTMLSDAQGFTLKSTYRTIRWAQISVGRKTTPAMVARAPNGLDTYVLRGNRWLSVRDTYLNFPPWANVQQSGIYAQISQQIESTPDIRSVYDDLDKKSDWTNNAQKISALPCTGTPSYCADFKTVQTQLATEALYVSYVYNFFTTNQTLTGTGTAGSDGYLGQASANITEVVSTLNISQSSTFGLNLASMITSIIGDLLSLVAPEAGVALQIAGTILGDSSLFVGDGGDLNVAVSNLLATLEQQQSNSITVNGCVQTYYLTDWSLMQPLGAGIDNNTITWTPDQQALATLIANKSLHLFIWKQLAPIKWQVYNVVGTGSGFDNGCSNYGWGVYCVVWDRWLYHGAFIRWNIATLADNYSVNTAGLDELTKPGGVDDPTHFGQNFTRMVFGEDGWDFLVVPPCYLQSCPDYYGGQPPSGASQAASDETVRLFKVPRENLEGALQRTRRLLREVRDAGQGLDGQRTLEVALEAAAEKLRLAVKSGKTSQFTAADGYIRSLIAFGQFLDARRQGRPDVDEWLAQAYRIRALLEVDGN